MAGALCEHDAAASYFDPTELIIAEGYSGKATIRQAETTERLRQKVLPAQSRGTTAVIAGSLAMTSTGRTVTLGLHGGDYTAAEVARALNAERLTLWKGVNGIYPTDPTENDPSTSNDYYARLSYPDVRLIREGDQVVHPLAHGTAADANIPVTIKSMDCQYSSGTTISWGE